MTLSVGSGSGGAVDENEFRRLFELSLDLVCVAGLDGYFKRVNPSWPRVMGWTEAELLSRPVEAFMHPDDRQQTLAAREGLTRGVPVRGLENRYLCKDGSYRWLSWQSSIDLGAGRVYAVARDITERRQLDHERLMYSKLECTGILAGGIAHDFNNLLGGLLLSLDMIRASGPVTADQRQYLQRARDSVHAASALTQQLITFADGGPSERRRVDLLHLIREATDVALLGATVTRVFRFDPRLSAVEVDEAQIAQVISGLVMNAREAMGDSGSVRVEADNVVVASGGPFGAPAGDYVRIRISDSGAGIPPDVLPRVFDPYFSTKERGARKGMGLGLTLCRSIVHKHGGAIAIESTPGQGTTVSVHLPALRS